MAGLRHGDTVQMSGWLLKDQKIGRWFRLRRSRRFFSLRGSVLSLHHAPNSPAKWEVSVLNCPVSEGAGKFELCVELPKRKVSLYAENSDSFAKWKRALKLASSRSVEDFYEIGKLLGKGAYAEVRCCQDRETKEEFAIKILNKDLGFHPTDIENLLNEMNIMKSVVHPNIITTFDVFDSKDALHIVMEYMGGGELFDIIAKAGYFSERRASTVMRELVSGVEYLHNHSIVHRDLKPENILCKSSTWPYQVKLADFGLANYIADDHHDGARPKNIIGTPGYYAPEMAKKERYGAPVDMWACGVILYIMLSGKMPFYGSSEQCMTMIIDGTYSFPDRQWSKISENARSLVKSLLQVDPNKRLTAKACLHHPWLAKEEELPDIDINNDLSALHSSRRKFRKVALAAITTTKIAMLASNTNKATAQNNPTDTQSALPATTS